MNNAGSFLIKLLKCVRWGWGREVSLELHLVKWVAGSLHSLPFTICLALPTLPLSWLEPLPQR